VTTSGVSVLICDDAPAIRFLLGVVISLREGMSVIGEAADGNEAIGQAELLQPDVILLDLSMPHCTGLEALPEINRVAPAARVIVLSGFASSILEAELDGHQVAAYLQKGSDPDEILAAIEAVVVAKGLDAAGDGPGRN
jgi:DNA-binding NarL/FixJ family response regulator